MQKIPQAVAMVLLMSALACPMCSGQVAKVGGQTDAKMQTRGSTEVEALLREFLSKVNDPAMHNRFWADDLIYVGAGGAVRTKAEIMKNVTEEAESMKGTVSSAAMKAAKDTDTSYEPEDVKVRQFNNVCVLNFRLVAKSEGKNSYYRNSGTFVERDGKWQVVSWQATKEAEAAK